jgi:hypothetical protein
MPRILPMLASIAMSFVMLSAASSPAMAAQTGPDFRLTAATPVSGTQIAGETLWRCGDSGCTAASATSRPAIVCAKAARSLGKLESFTFRDSSFDVDALAKCNAKAK